MVTLKWRWSCVLHKFLWGYLTLLSFPFFESILEARPGGGQNYSGGGGGGGGGGYSHSSSNYGHSFGRSSGNSEADSTGAVIGAVVLIIIVYAVSSKKKKSIRAEVRIDPKLLDQSLAQLKKQDPRFSADAFLQRTKAIVERVNQAWLDGSMEKARGAISDGVYVRFQTQLHLLKAQGLRNFMLDWKLLSTELLASESDARWDTIHVKIVAEARDVDVLMKQTEEESKAQAQKEPRAQYQEIWSFVRRKGTQSQGGIPALEGHCPNCGADLPISQSMKCDHCQAIANSGEYDFVLSEITQPEEWTAQSSNQTIPGLDLLQKQDRTVSRQELEDRASVFFWKWVEASSTLKLEKLARFCAKPLSDEQTLRSINLIARNLTRVAVGSADVRFVKVNPETNEEEAFVDIRWSASIDGFEPTPMRHIFKLTRSVESKSKQGLSCLDCPFCGGPLAESDAVVCTYCGEQLAGNKMEWALCGVSASM